jgi:hypothetical protein
MSRKRLFIFATLALSLAMARFGDSAIQSGSVLLQANFSLTQALGGTFGSTGIAANFNGSSQGLTVQLTPGSGVNQFQNIYAGGQSVPSGSPVSLNLTDGSLKMPDGSATNFADIEALVIRNNGAAVLTVGGGTAAVTSIGSITVNPGASAVLIASASGSPYTVTASTANVVKLTSASGTLAVDVMIVGH